MSYGIKDRHVDQFNTIDSRNKLSYILCNDFKQGHKNHSVEKGQSLNKWHWKNCMSTLQKNKDRNLASLICTN